MPSGNNGPKLPAGLSGTNLRIGVIRASWNEEVVNRLADGVAKALNRLSVKEVTWVSVPGCLEIPLAAQLLAQSGNFDSLVVIGAVIRGETTHYELVSEGAAEGVLRVQLDSGVPIGFGLLTVENHQQAMDRSEGEGGHNVGEEATEVAVQMALLATDWHPTI
ncbi:MAG: 6,7-dimethyl-8-ribityllumazine synthase [Actinomycetota bacterium]|nr:6,7-dimethyl-8-ribityllumazine synthase [Acidimicrobiales bacterium]